MQRELSNQKERKLIRIEFCILEKQLYKLFKQTTRDDWGNGVLWWRESAELIV